MAIDKTTTSEIETRIAEIGSTLDLAHCLLERADRLTTELEAGMRLAPVLTLVKG